MRLRTIWSRHGMVLTQMMGGGAIDEARAREIAQRMLGGNAAELYKLEK